MSSLFEKQYDKDFILFMSKYKDDTGFEISLKNIIKKTLDKELKYHCLIPVFLFLLSSLLILVFMFSCFYLTDQINNALVRGTVFCLGFVGGPMIMLVMSAITEEYYNIKVSDFFDILKTREGLLKEKFNVQRATPELIKIIEESCDKENKDLIMYELMNNGTRRWYSGTNGRLKGFYHRETTQDYESTDKSSKMSSDIKKSVTELNATKKAWAEKQIIMNNTKIEEMCNLKETKKRL